MLSRFYFSEKFCFISMLNLLLVYPGKNKSRQRGRMDKSVVFTATMIAWYGSTPTLIMLLGSWIRRFTMIIYAWWLRTTANSVDKKSKDATGTLDFWKLLNWCGFLQARSSQCNEKQVNGPTVSAWQCPVTRGLIFATTITNTFPDSWKLEWLLLKN